MNHVGLAIGGLAALGGAVMYAAAKPVPVATPAPFSERFPPEQPHILKKQDRLISLPVKTVAVAAVDVADAGQINAVDLMAPSEPDLTSAQDEPAPPRHKHVEQVVEHNVCTRHHLRKVITRGGKSWRCRR